MMVLTVKRLWSTGMPFPGRLHLASFAATQARTAPAKETPLGKGSWPAEPTPLAREASPTSLAEADVVDLKSKLDRHAAVGRMMSVSRKMKGTLRNLKKTTMKSLTWTMLLPTRISQSRGVGVGEAIKASKAVNGTFKEPKPSLLTAWQGAPKNIEKICEVDSAETLCSH